ncbi:inositol 1,4,5-trisphosphate receptor-interacting protein-like 1 [Numida meleagris]|uniref:inositol 1,4,5-trisphosphate receptor-interacting protein-like 1 n=1 Tax=Numida meleagris TaxID=8996 RepID=UPI000B3DC790|nr:inositol 1,4,5-trisphosphate receptor-interacting protein-like 1 [Numida meleagris]
MALAVLLALLALKVQSVGVDDDAATLERMYQREVYLQEQMTRMLLEIEQRNMEQSWVGVPALLFPLLDYWKLWFSMGLFFLLFWITWRSLRRNQRKEEEPEQQDQQVEEVEQEGQAEQAEQVEPVEEEGQESQEDEEDDEYFHDSVLTRYLTLHALAKLKGRARRCQLVEELMSDLLQSFRSIWSDSFFPVLQPAIGVGSAFEGWSPREEDTLYCLLVPMEAPRGHVFVVELGSEGELLARNSRIRVELVCTCVREQQPGGMLCFLHSPEDKLSQNQGTSLLHTLCTGSYLDVQRTATWFNLQVAGIWTATRRARAYNLRVLPSSRSCKLQLTKTSSREKLHVELLFGVQQGNSDIFLSSQNSEAGFTPSTTWPQSCAVAEKKIFEYAATNAGPSSSHKSCLRLFAHVLVGMGFSTYTIKTIVFYLLTTMPPETWQRRNFLGQLQNILQYLQNCLQKKRLDHFLLANSLVPKEVVLPQAFRAARPLNLFQHLEQDPDAHSQALSDCRELKDRLHRLLVFGR